jgi:hypothetical protein
MDMKKTLLLGSFVLFAIAAQPIHHAHAQAPRSSATFEGAIFHPHELSLDLFGTWATRDRRYGADDRAGAGVGVNYFITEHFGVSADTYLERVTWPTHLDLSVVARWPFEAWRLAPYGFAGGGRQWRHGSQWTAHVGGGADFRIMRQGGVFADARRIFTERAPDFTLVRFGLRFAF